MAKSNELRGGVEVRYTGDLRHSLRKKKGVVRITNPRLRIAFVNFSGDPSLDFEDCVRVQFKNLEVLKATGKREIK